MKNTAMFELCYLYYDEKTMEHAKRVANEAEHLCELFYDNNYNNYNYLEKFIFQLGLAHDLYEDTTIRRGIWFDDEFENNLLLLTKEKNEDYNEYIKKIHDKAKNNFKYMPAYIVKLADLRDHLAQKDTLTDKLRDKYVSAMPYIL